MRRPHPLEWIYSIMLRTVPAAIDTLTSLKFTVMPTLRARCLFLTPKQFSTRNWLELKLENLDIIGRVLG